MANRNKPKNYIVVKVVFLTITVFQTFLRAEWLSKYRILASFKLRYLGKYLSVTTLL